MGQPLRGQAAKLLPGQPDVVEDDGILPEHQHPLDVEHGVAALQGQRTLHVGRCPHAPAVDHPADRLHGRPLVWAQAQEAELRLALVVRHHIGALALAAHQQPLGSQHLHGLAHRALAHAEALRQIGLAGDEPARRPFAGLQRVQDGFTDLLVERLEARRSRCIHGRKSGE